MSELVVHTWGNPSAPPMVLLHGINQAGTAWPDAVAQWQDRFFLIAPDQRGFGLSPRFTPAERERMFAVWIEDVAAVIARYTTAPVVLVGHSLGGRIAVGTALTHPTLCRALVLEDPALTPVAYVPPEFIAQQHAFLDRFTTDSAAEVTRMRRDSTWSDAEITAWAACKPLVDRDMLSQLDIGPLTTEPALNELRVPALIVWDADGPWCPAPTLVTNPLIQQEFWSGIGHNVRRAAPHRYYRRVEAFLSTLAF